MARISHPSRLALLLCASLSSSFLQAQQTREPTLPDGAGKQLTTVVCSQCHGLRETTILRDGQQGWEEVVDRMVLYGAQLSPSEAQTVTRYLTMQFGPRDPSAPVAPTPPPGAHAKGTVTISLAAGPGKELVAERCSLCHTLEKVVSSTRTTADWNSIMNNMLQRGMPATPDETTLMVAYLKANYSR